MAFTAQEFDVLMQLLERQITRQMAEALKPKPSTIQTYLHRLFRKTHSSTRTALVKWWEMHVEAQAHKSGREKTGKEEKLGDRQG